MVESGPNLLSLQERTVASLVQINGLFRDVGEGCLDAYGIEELPANGTSSSGDDLTIMWNGPGMWMLESRERQPQQLIPELRSKVEVFGGTVTDLSSSRTIIHVSGSKAREFLMKGCPFDVEKIENRSVLSSLIGHFTVLIHCIDNQFDLYVYQTFGEYFWHWCRHNGREFL